MTISQAVIDKVKPTVAAEIVPTPDVLDCTDVDATQPDWVEDDMDNDEYDDDSEGFSAGKVFTKENFPTIAIGIAIILVLVAVGISVYVLRREAVRESQLKDWVATYLYEAVSGDGMGLLTEEQIEKISEDVSISLKPMLTEAFDLDNLTEEQKAKFVAQIQEELNKNDYALSATDVATISEGVVEKYIKENYSSGLNGASGAELAAVQKGIANLKAQDKQLQTSISTVSATKGATGAAGAQGPQGIQGAQGIQGKDGKAGKDGATGKSAYEVAVVNGFTGTEAQWLESLKGYVGADGAAGTSSFVMYSQYPNGVDTNGTPSLMVAPDITTGYVGVANVVATSAPSDPSAYTWSVFSQHTIEYDDSTGVPTVIIH